MHEIHEPTQTVPVVHECDVCVIGGSCTGVFAAVAAARLGASAAVIENNGMFGGVASAGLVNIWHSLLDSANEQTIIAGLTREVVERLRKRNAVNEVNPPSSDAQFTLNTAELAIELDALVTESGIRPFLHTKFVRPVAEDGRMQAAIIEDKTGRRAVAARVFIDATGDADVVHRLGLETHTDSVLQPATGCVHMKGVDDVLKANPNRKIAEIVHDPAQPEALKQGFLWHSRVVGAEELAMIAGTRAHGADCSDADQLTRAEMETRRQIRAIGDILRRQPGGENIAIVTLPSYIGIRQSRQARCMHQLLEREVLEGLRFEDAIANGSYRVDVHHPDKPGLTFRYLDGVEEYVAPGEPRQTGRWREQRDADPTFYQIPYRCMVPAGAENVLAAGRAIDADRGAFGAVRVMVNCNQTGQAAGVAAHLAIESGRSVGDVDIAKLRETLAAQGAIII